MMLDLVIAVVPRSDLFHDVQRGEVMEIMPTGHPWSEIELTTHNWHILRCDMLLSHATMLKAPHTPSHLRVRGKHYPRRMYLLDLDKIAQAEKFKGVRNEQIVEITEDELEAATIKVEFEE